MLKSAAEVGCDPILLGCNLGCVCVCFFFLFFPPCCDRWLKEEVWVAIWVFLIDADGFVGLMGLIGVVVVDGLMGLGSVMG